MSWPIISDNPQLQADYEAMREKGETHKLAEMLALQTGPYMRDENRMLLEGHCNGNEFEKDQESGTRYRQQAKAAGVSTTGRKYLGQLARFPGDPQAWVQDASDVKRICRERNLGCDGAIKHKSHETAPRPAVPIADSVIREEVSRQIAEDPGKATKVVEVVEATKERLTPYWKK